MPLGLDHMAVRLQPQILHEHLWSRQFLDSAVSRRRHSAYMGLEVPVRSGGSRGCPVSFTGLRLLPTNDRIHDLDLHGLATFQLAGKSSYKSLASEKLLTISPQPPTKHKVRSQVPKAVHPTL